MNKNILNFDGTAMTNEEADIYGSDFYAAVPCVVKAQVDQNLEHFVEEELIHILLSNEKHQGLLVDESKKTEQVKKKLTHLTKYKIDTGGFTSLDMADVNKLKKPPLIVIGTGFLSLANSPGFNRIDYVDPWPDAENNDDFKDWKDPMNRFGLLSANPMVIVCDEKMLDGRPIPTSWRDLADPKWAESIVYPENEEFMRVFFLPYFISMYGKEIAEKFYENCLFPSHPAEMLRRGNLPKHYPIYIMPYFFAGMKLKEDDETKLVWTKEGALLSPVFITVKEDLIKKKSEETETEHIRYETVKVLLNYLRSEQLGKVLYGNGKFPVNILGVDNKLPGPLKWIGWENLSKSNYNELEEEARVIMDKKKGK